VLLKPVLVGQAEFLEWSCENHLRHSEFAALREDKNATPRLTETRPAQSVAESSPRGEIRNIFALVATHKFVFKKNDNSTKLHQSNAI
jgi:hypothetical protein